MMMHCRLVTRMVQVTENTNLVIFQKHFVFITICDNWILSHRYGNNHY